MLTDREYFRKYEAEEQWQKAASEEADDRLDDMSVEEMATKIWETTLPRHSGRSSRTSYTRR